jgi:hypothetical protein
LTKEEIFQGYKKLYGDIISEEEVVKNHYFLIVYNYQKLGKYF